MRSKLGIKLKVLKNKAELAENEFLDSVHDDTYLLLMEIIETAKKETFWLIA